MNPLIQLKTTPPILITLALLCFGLSPTAKAVVPAPDGFYPGSNTAEGENALFSLTSGINNTGVGAGALHDNTTGGYNVGIGARALFSNTTGSFNMAVGTEALRDNTANFNSAIGYRVGFKNTTGRHLTGMGAGALQNNTTASFNTAIGAAALHENTTGGNNTAIGADALAQNVDGNNNNAVGVSALGNNTTGAFNTANGVGAMNSNTGGFGNTAVGAGALEANTNGFSNTAIGVGALAESDALLGGGNTAVGTGALGNSTSGNFNTALGLGAGDNVTTAHDVTVIGANVPGANVSSTTWIGNIFGVTTQSGITAPVVVSDNGQLGTVASSERFKKDIATMNQASEAILSLRPVTFHYKTDSKGTPQFGLIAEEVAKVNPALVLPDKEGKPYTVRYEQVNAMLLNEFLKEHRTVQELKKEVAALAAGLQKVSAQLEASKPAPQVVNNP